MTEQKQLEQLTRETARLLLSLAKKTWPGRGAGIMGRALLLEEENDIPHYSVNFYSEDDFGGKYSAVSLNGIERWAYYPDESPIEKEGEVE